MQPANARRLIQHLVFNGTSIQGKNRLCVIFKSILSYAAESWATTSKYENSITAAEMKFLRTSLGKTRRDRSRNATVREQPKEESLIDGIERRKLRWYGHLVRMAEDRKPRQILEARIEGMRGRGRPRKVWMDDIKEADGRRGKTIQEARSMPMTRKDLEDGPRTRRWTAKGKDKEEEEVIFKSGSQRQRIPRRLSPLFHTSLSL